MPSPSSRSSYEFRIRGRISPAPLEGFEGMSSELEPVETILHGPVPDQAALHGMIDRIQSLGLELVEVRRLPAPSGSGAPAGGEGGAPTSRRSHPDP
jgi:hypothetical protein